MLKIADEKQVKDARKLLIEQFKKGNRFVESTTYPGDPILEAKVYWSEKDKLGAHFLTTPFKERWECCYGTDDPGPKHNLKPNIAINFSVEQRDKDIFGRVLVDGDVDDDSGEYYLGHKGGLGGSGSWVTMDRFAELIKGFEREPVSWPADGSHENVFVIGKIGSPEFIGQLQKYVSESKRIRTYQKTS